MAHTLQALPLDKPQSPLGAPTGDLEVFLGLQLLQRESREKKPRTALTASSHNRAWQDTRTTRNIHLGRWAPWVSGEGGEVGLYFPDKQLCVLSRTEQASHLLGSIGLRASPQSPFSPSHLTPSPWFKNPQITGRRSLEGEEKSKQTLVPVIFGKFIHRSALSQAPKTSPGAVPLKTSLE